MLDRNHLKKNQLNKDLFRFLVLKLGFTFDHLERGLKKKKKKDYQCPSLNLRDSELIGLGVSGH